MVWPVCLLGVVVFGYRGCSVTGERAIKLCTQSVLCRAPGVSFARLVCLLLALT